MSVIQRCLAIDPNKRPKPDELLKELLADLPGDQTCSACAENADGG